MTSNLQPLRDYIRTHLARSLSDPDARLAAAWTAACGRALAARGSVAAYDPATAAVRIRVTDAAWLEPLNALRSKLIGDLARISGLPVKQLDFQLEKKPETGRVPGRR